MNIGNLGLSKDFTIKKPSSATPNVSTLLMSISSEPIKQTLKL